MTDVEQKVVQMRFDDKDFDEKAQKTMKTLDKLADKLSFDEVAKRSDAAFKEVTENVEKIADQAYTIVDRVIDKIRNDIADKLVGYIKSATIDQVANGWQKYADMTSAVGTLLSQGHKIEKVNKTLEDLSYFADETSYSFNDMLSGISSFTAAGVKLDDAKVALMGISNWAAQSGKNAQTASALFIQLSQAMGTYMKKQDWASVQTANMDTQEFKQTALDTAVALGTLKETSKGVYKSLVATTSKGADAFNIDSFADSLTQGAWLTRDVMVETYKKYAIAVDKIKAIYDETGGDVKTGSIIRERQKLNKEIIKQYQEVYKVDEETARTELDKWTSVTKATEEEIQNYATLNKISKEVADKKINASYYNAVEEYSKRTRKSMKETEKDMEQWSEYISEFSLKAFLNAQEARTFSDVISSVKESAASAWREIYTAIFGDYNEAKVLWTDLAEGLISLFTDRLYKIADIFTEWKEAGGRDTLMQGLYAFGWGIGNLIQNIRDAWDNLVSNGQSGVSVLMRISEKIQEAGFKFYIFVERLTEKGFFKDIAEALYNIKHFIDQVFGAFYDGFRDAMPAGGFFLNLLLEFAHILKELTSNFKLSDEAVDGLRRTFKGLTIILMKSKKTFVQLLVKVILPVLNAVFSILGQIVEVIVTITGTLGDILEYFMPLDSETSGLVTILEVLTSVLTEVIKLAGTGITWVLKKIVPLIGVVIGMVAGLIDGLGELFSAKKFKMGSGNNQLLKNFDALKERILYTWAPLKSFTDIIDEYKNGKGLVNFLNMFADITDGIGNRLLLTMDATIGFIETLGESKFGKVLAYALKALRMLVKGAIWLFNNLLVPILKEIIMELGLTIESIKGIIDERGIMGLLDLIQEMFKTGIFGALVNTINLFNGLIGSNGLGRLFSKGAKALESIASYFNAAKMNQAAEVMLKIVAAMGMLYVLLALITFLPTEHAEKMRDAMLEFGIALGIVVGGVFVISAAAALAGGNLIALAAGFVGVGIAITTALWALQEMVDFIDRESLDKIDAALGKLEKILSKYALFIVKIVAPMSLVALKYNGDVGGLGLAMAGLAASIWILLKALQSIDSVDITSLDNLFDFLTGVYAVLAVSTSVMILAARGQNVHGISIAIASVGVAFAAVKMIFPLCKDVIAEQEVLVNGKEALIIFGAFMLAFAASMYLVTSGVRGILSSIAAILLFKSFIAIMTNTLLPAAEEFIEAVVRIGTILNKANFLENHNWVSVAIAFAGIAAAIWFMVTQWRYLLGFWSDMDTASIISMALAIVGTFAIITWGLIPAIKDLNEALQANSLENTLSLMGTLALLFSPLYAIIIGMTKIMDAYSTLYGSTKNAQYKLSIGLITRDYNPVASIFSSMMWMLIGITGIMTGFLYLANQSTWDKGKIEMIKTVMIGMGAVVLTIVVPLIIFLSTIMGQLDSRLKDAQKNHINSSWGPAGLLKKTEDTVTSVIKALTNVISIVAIFIPGLMLAMGFLIKSIDVIEMDKWKELMITSGLIIAGLMTGLALLALAITSPFRGKYAYMMSQINNTAFYSSAAAAASQIGVIALSLTLLFAAFSVVSIVAGTMTKDDYEQMLSAMKWAGIALVGIMVGFYLFTDKINGSLQSHNFQANANTNLLAALAPAINMLLASIGIVGTLLSLGGVLLPAIRELQSMDLEKLTSSLTMTLVLIFGSIIGMVAAVGIDKKTGDLTPLGNLVSTLKMILVTVIPMISVAIAMGMIADAFAKLGQIAKDKIEQVKWVFLLFALIDGLVIALGVLLSGDVTGVVYGKAIGAIAAIAATFLAIGGAALMIGYAANLIADAYAKWLKIQFFQARISSIISNEQALNKAIEEGAEDIYDTGENIGERLVENINKGAGVDSPSTETTKTGKFIDAGLILGMNKGRRDIMRTSKNLAKLPNSIFQSELGIASPSKVFYKNGRFIVAGINEGMQSGKSTLEDTMGDLANTITDSFNKSFENMNIDIWGGEDPIEKIKKSIGNLDAGSIVGKMLGLQTQITEQERQQYEYIKMMGGQVPEWYKNGEFDVVTEPDNSTSGKIAKKISNFFKSGTITETMKKIGKDLGITSGEEAGESLSTKIKSWLVGDDGQSGAFGDIISKVKDGDWSGVGRSIGESLSSSLNDAFNVDNIKRKIHNVMRLFNLSEFGVLDTFVTRKVSKEKTRITSIPGAPDYAAIEEKYTETYNQLMVDLRNRDDILDVIKSDEKAVEAYEQLFDRYAKGDQVGAMFDFSEDFNVDELVDAIDIDYEKRMGEFLVTMYDAISAGQIQAITDDYGNVKYVLTKQAEDAIKALMKTWGIGSPSKVMRNMYCHIPEGEALGIKDGEKTVLDAIDDSTSEQYRQLSLGVQGLDQLATSIPGTVTPSIVPMVDTSGLDPVMPLLNGDTTSRIEASLDHTNSVNMLAAAQLRIADAMDSFKRDVLAALNLGELIKVDVHDTVNDSNLFDHFVTIDRQEYNRTGRHAW